MKFRPDYVEDDKLTYKYNSIVPRFDNYMCPACEPPTLSELTPMLSRTKEAKK